VIELDPCAVCRRHVAVTEPACPFCGAALPARTAQAFAPLRLSRAAVFVAGAALAACGGGKKDSTVQTHAISSDAGVGAPDATATNDDLPDRRQQHHGGGGCTSPGNGQPPVCMPYGAPPARRRLV
jgi:hypothetical protein